MRCFARGWSPSSGDVWDGEEDVILLSRGNHGYKLWRCGICRVRCKNSKIGSLTLGLTCLFRDLPIAFVSDSPFVERLFRQCISFHSRSSHLRAAVTTIFASVNHRAVEPKPSSLPFRPLQHGPYLILPLIWWGWTWTQSSSYKCLCVIVILTVYS